jgi:predicted dehydrogenase
MSMDKIKIGQIGIRHEHAGGIMQSLRNLPEVFEVVGVVDDRSSRSAAFPGSNLSVYDGLPWLSEEELLSHPGLQAVCVETANYDLVPTALRCLDKFLPLHMDKPGGDDLALFRRLREGYEDRGLPFHIGYMFRGNPAMCWLQSAVKRGLLGDIFEIHGCMSHCYGGDAYQEYLGQMQGGIMFNLGCHLLDLVVSLMGRPQKVTSILRSTSGLPDNLANNALAILEYKHCIVSINACSKEIFGSEKRRLKVCGSKGTAELSPLECFDGRSLKLQLQLAEGSDDLPPGAQILDFGVRYDRYREHLLEFAGMIRGEVHNPYNAKHDCLTQEVLLAASSG